MVSKIIAGIGFFVMFFILGLILRCASGWVLGWLAAAVTHVQHISGIPMTSVGVIVALLSMLWTVSISAQ